MKIRSQRNQLIDMVGKATTTVRMPTGSYQILAHTKIRWRELSWESIVLRKRLFVFSVLSRLRLSIQKRLESLICPQMQRWFCEKIRDQSTRIGRAP